MSVKLYIFVYLRNYDIFFIDFLHFFFNFNNKTNKEIIIELIESKYLPDITRCLMSQTCSNKWYIMVGMFQAKWMSAAICNASVVALSLSNLSLRRTTRYKQPLMLICCPGTSQDILSLWECSSNILRDRVKKIYKNLYKVF